MSDRSYFLDTNIFLRIIVKDDPQKVSDCVRLIELIRSGSIRGITSHIVLAEIVWTCLSWYKITKSDIIKLVRGIVGIPHLTFFDDFDTLHALALYHDHGVKFIDALLASHALVKSAGVSLVSYDKDFDALGVTRLEPSDIL